MPRRRRKHHNKPYEPSSVEIAETARQIREEGFCDEKGIWHHAWGHYDERPEATDGRQAKMD